MNSQEIDNMMRGHNPQESTLSKVWIGTWFIVFLIVCVMAPDIFNISTEETTYGNGKENTSQDSNQGLRKESSGEGLK
jgi:hypothetical protein